MPIATVKSWWGERRGGGRCKFKQMEALNWLIGTFSEPLAEWFMTVLIITQDLSFLSVPENRACKMSYKFLECDREA